MSNCGCCSKHDVEPPTQKLRIKDVAVFLILMGSLSGAFFLSRGQHINSHLINRVVISE